MSSRDESDHLRDILRSIDFIVEFIWNMSFESYLLDRKTQAAVERELSIISEAGFRLKDQAATLCPDIDWRAVRGMGNVLRHGYSKVESPEIWETVQSDLGPLRKSVENALFKLKASTSL